VSADPAIVVEQVSKRFKLFHERPTSLKERVLRLRGTRAEDFWALRDVTAEIRPGTTVGLIGANGSGKTTLLKIIGGILRPTSGTVRTKGRIAALLELGAGFHPELTGRENVYLNASILGLSRKETGRYFDQIVDFAELGQFIDNQVKYYSSGMFVRLGFAVAIHVDPEILLVDEVLAVGDEAFQRKCLGRVREFQEEGRTMVIVSHDPDLVSRVCDEAIMLDRGSVRLQGEVREVVKEFRAHMLQFRAPFVRDDATGEVEILGVSLLDRKGQPSDTGIRAGAPLTIQVDLQAARPVDDPVVSVAVYDAADRLMFKTGTDWTGTKLGTVDGKRRVRFKLSTIPFTDGRYHVTVGVHSPRLETIYDWHDHRYAFDIRRDPPREGSIWVPHDVEVEEL
jgi:ABC-2 type transport system ATP-binding protein